MKNIPLFPKRSSVRTTDVDPSAAEDAAPPVRAAGRRLPRARWIALVAFALASTAAAAPLALALFLPARISLDGVSAELPPNTPIGLSLPHLGATVEELAVTEASRDADGVLSPEKPVAVKLVPAAKGMAVGLWSELQLARQDGSRLLEYDRVYRLRLSLRTKALALPTPKDVLVTRDYQFSTITTPQVRLPQGIVEMAYQKPLELQWNSPIQDFSVETQPKVQTRTWVDSSRPGVGYVELQGAEAGARYEIRVTEALGINGASILAPATLTVETAASPKPITGSVRLEDGDRVVLRWDRPVQRLEYQITPAVQSSVRVDPGDRRVTYLSLQAPKQQQEYKIKVTGGAGTSGAPIAAGPELSIATPPPMEVAKLSPRGDAYGIPLDSAINITFGEAVKNRAGAQAAISFEPVLQGRFEWPDSDQMRFVPASLPDNTDITVRIAAGAKGVRGTSGSHLEEDYEYSFRTQPNKLIEVDLTRQTLTLWEGDKDVYTGLVAAGVPGAPTPTGLFMVDYKMQSTRMKGVNPDGSHYDIPNVPWVMSFEGDYTLHGAPWRTRFGYPGSNGCVSMEPGQAKMLYDWSPIGTPVRVHW